MNGLVKVGKTTRDPEERAAELSRSTGVPAPFIVGYQREVNDCTRAEEFVHTYLTNLGCRVNDNREFFRATLTTAIDAILEYCKLENSSGDTFSAHTSDGNLNNYDDLDDESAHFSNLEMPLHLVECGIGNKYLYGLEDCIQDFDEALKHYKLAIKYGSPYAYRLIGKMYMYGLGVKRNYSTALNYFKQGIEHGDYLSYAYMVHVYLIEGNKQNADKCFFKAMNLCDKGSKPEVCYEYINTCLDWEIPIEQDKIELMYPYKKDIVNQFNYLGDDERKKHVQEIIFNYTLNEQLCEVEEELGKNYYYGVNGYTQDYDESLKHFKRAIQCESVEAYKYIGHMYSVGDGVQENRATALKYYDQYLLRAIKLFDEENKPDACVEYIDCCLLYLGVLIKQDKIELMRPYKDEIIKRSGYERLFY